MANGTNRYLSRREREIMDILYRLGEATVSEVAKHMSDDTSYDSVRITLGILKKKGYVTHHRESRHYVYSPKVSREEASRSAARNLIRTFFGGSPMRAVLTLLDESSDRLSEDELEKIADWLKKEKKA